METIIAATDFSPAASNAIAYAVELAALFKAKIVLVHAFDSPASITATEDGEELILKAAETAQKNLENLRSALQYEQKDIECIAELGSPYEVINSAVVKYNADLVVLGITSNATKFKENISGSNAIKTAREQEVPVFIIPEGVKYKPVKKIGYACDVKKDEEADIIFIVRWFCQFFSAELEVIKIEGPEEFKTAQKLERDLFLENKLKNIKHKTILIKGNDPAAKLEDYFNSHDLDLIILSPKKHNLFYTLFKHSVTKELAFHSSQPILAIH